MNESNRQMYVTNSDALTITEAVVEADASALRSRARRAANKYLAAKALKAEAEKVMKDLKPKLIELSDELGESVINTADGKKVQVVRPVSIKVVGNDDLVKKIERHRPEFLDSIAPATRTINRDTLRAFIEGGSVPESWSKHLVPVEGAPQIR